MPTKSYEFEAPPDSLLKLINLPGTVIVRVGNPGIITVEVSGNQLAVDDIEVTQKGQRVTVAGKGCAQANACSSVRQTAVVGKESSVVQVSGSGNSVSIGRSGSGNMVVVNSNDDVPTIKVSVPRGTDLLQSGVSNLIAENLRDGVVG